MNYSQLVQEQKKAVWEDQLTSVSHRIEYLKTLRMLVSDNEKKLCNAVSEDFGKPYFESFSSEIYTTIHELDYHLKNVSEWAKPKSVRGSVTAFPSKNYVYRRPFGSVLIIGPWNYPILLILQPLIGALSAGNTAIIKPSEMAPATSACIKSLADEYFEPKIVSVAEGDAETSRHLLSLPFDKFFFTGSPRVGKIVMKAAAEQLIPVTLELGGKSPAIILEDANPEVSAKRVMWGKTFNAGQTCVAPDYALVHENIYDTFIDHCKQALTTFFDNDYKPGENYTQIVNKHHFSRLRGLLKNTEVLTGGNTDTEKRFIEPTLVRAGWDDEIMQDEIFGPLLPVIPYNDTDSMIRQVNRLAPPLALYIFSENKNFQDRIMSEIPFGGGCINDTIVHFGNPSLAVGGVGKSGMGSYHGKYSFDTFSRPQSILKKQYWPDPDFRYPPYDESKIAWIKRLFMR